MSFLFDQNILNVDVHTNDMSKRDDTKPEDREGNFFRDIPRELAEKLYKVYELDFVMFGYDFDFEKYYGRIEEA